MGENEENKEETSGESIIDKEVMAAIKRKTELREEEQRTSRFMERPGREISDALYYGTSIPILAVVGALIGWYLTRDSSATLKVLGVAGGAILGLLWGVFEIIRKEQKKSY